MAKPSVKVKPILLWPRWKMVSSRSRKTRPRQRFTNSPPEPPVDNQNRDRVSRETSRDLLSDSLLQLSQTALHISRAAAVGRRQSTSRHCPVGMTVPTVAARPPTTHPSAPKPG